MRKTKPKTANTPLHLMNWRKKRTIKGMLNMLTEAPESWMAIDLPQSFSAKYSVIKGIADGRYMPMERPNTKLNIYRTENAFTNGTMKKSKEETAREVMIDLL